MSTERAICKSIIYMYIDKQSNHKTQVVYINMQTPFNREMPAAFTKL